ncbi:MAG: LptF/LptG family permease [Bacteroidales bacterium]|nr:LptF/LptG family permease [Bacteroidales bacterium]
MKKLDRLILKSFVGPLALTFAIAVFVLLMQFVWKYVDDLVGKGLEFKVIAELLLYASATFVPMALPIATLFASIMTMGNFGEKYELVAIKAGGISLRRVMMPMVLVVLLLTGVAFYFANNVMPVAMLKYRTALYDITRKKPAFNIRPNEYYTDINGYVIRIDQKDSDGRSMRDITIFDHTHGATTNNIIVANSGIMQVSPDQHYLVFTLYDGCNYSEDIGGKDYVTRPMTRVEFEEQVLTFDISDFAFDKSEAGFLKGGYQMMNISQLDTAVRKLKHTRQERFDDNAQVTVERMKCYMQFLAADTVEPVYKLYMLQSRQSTWCAGAHPPMRACRNPKPSCSGQLAANHLRQARSIADAVRNDARVLKEVVKADDEYINRHYIEWQRKYTLSVACLLLFLIGAPFGSIVRKGGLGMPLVASVAFFVFYYVVGMIAEKAVRESAMGPIGMWMSTFVLLPLGIFFTYKATTDSALFDLATWKRRLHIGRKNQNQ